MTIDLITQAREMLKQAKFGPHDYPDKLMAEFAEQQVRRWLGNAIMLVKWGDSSPVSESANPVPVHISCPKCGTSHIDEGEWATRPHKTHQCQNCKHEWRPFPYATVGVSESGGQPVPNLSNPLMRQAYESGVDTGFKTAQLNPPDQIKWWFNEREAAVIDEIATKQQLSRQAVLRQALRTYQLVVTGTHELTELNPMSKVAASQPSSPVMTAEQFWKDNDYPQLLRGEEVFKFAEAYAKAVSEGADAVIGKLKQGLP